MRLTLFSKEEHPSLLVQDGNLDNVTNIHVDNNLPDPTQVGEVVEAAIEMEEVQHLDSEITKEIEIQEAHEEAAAELQEVVQEQEQAIDQAPEQITEDNVRIAQESLAYSLGRLGLSFKEHRAQRLSVETHANYPVDKLRITVEGIKEVIDKIIAKIKEIFKRIGNFFRELYLKAVMVFDKTQKQAEYLLKVYAKGERKAQLEPETCEYIIRSIPLIADKNNRNAMDIYKLNNDFAISGVDVYSTIVGKLSVLNAKPVDVVSGIAEVLDKVKGKQQAYYTKLEKSDNLKWQYCFNNGYMKILNVNPKTETVFVETINFMKGKDALSNSQEYAKIINAIMTKPVLTQMLQDALTNSRNAKAYVEKIKKARDQANTGLEAIRKNPNPTEDDKIRLKLIGQVGGQIALDLVSAYIKWNKGLVNIAELCLDRKTIDKGILNAAR